MDAVIDDGWRPVPGYEGVYRVNRDGRVQRLVGGRNTRAGLLLQPGQPMVSLHAGENRWAVRRTTLIRAVFGGEVPMARLDPIKPRHCWAWDVIQEKLTDGPLSVAVLAEAVYGDATEPSRRAMSSLCWDLCQSGRKYLGGPYLVPTRRGYYGLADREIRGKPTESHMISLLKAKPRTLRELATKTRLTDLGVRSALRRLRSVWGIEITTSPAPREMWSNPKQYCLSYRILPRCR